MPQWAKRDEVATRAARKAKRFLSRRSWIGTRKNGDIYIRLHGRDKAAQYQRLHGLWNGICAICGLPVRRGDEDLEHNLPLGKGGDDSDSNLRFTHKMHSQDMPCHRAKHNREVRLHWLPKVAEEGA